MKNAKRPSLLFILLFISALLAGAVRGAEPLNVLWIVTDDHRADSIQAWNRAMTGKSESELGYVLSPRADLLASEGVLFTQAYCNSPACAPSRKSMHTGLYPHHVGQYGFEITHAASDVAQKNLPEFMEALGYGTLRVGKNDHCLFGWDGHKLGNGQDVYRSVIDMDKDYRWHGYGDWYNAKRREKGVVQGIETLWNFPDGLVGLYYPEEGEPTEGVVRKAEEIELQLDLLRSYTRSQNQELIIGGVNPQPTSGSLDGKLVAAFTDWLAHEDKTFTTAADRKIPGPPSDKPLFTHFAFPFPHTPVLPSKEFRDRFAGKTYRVPEFDESELASLPPQLVKLHEKCNFSSMTAKEKQQAIRDYYAFCAMGDTLVGEAVDAFKAQSEKQGRGYLILYVIGDHGWHLGEQGMEAKFGPYREANRCAVIAVSSDKQTWPAGKVCRKMVEFVDFAPTILRAGGANLKEKRYAHLDGVPLEDTLHGKAPEREYVISELNHVVGPRANLRSRDFAFSMRVRKLTGKPGDTWGPKPGEDILWGLDAPRADVEMALFDLRNDPHERRNVAGNPRYIQLADWFRNKLGRIVLGDGRVECDWAQENNYVISDFAQGAHDGKLDIPPAIIPVITSDGDVYPELRKQVSTRLSDLKNLVAQAASQGIDTSREKVTLVTAKLFLDFAAYDREHTDELIKACKGYYRIKDEAEAYSHGLPVQELYDTLAIIEAAVTELETVMKNPNFRRTKPAVDFADLSLKEGYFHYNDRPLFPSEFSWMPRDPELIEVFGNIATAVISPGAKKKPEWTARVAMKEGNFDETMGNIFFGHGAMPAWAQEKYPGIGYARRCFTHYDIDHPGAREVWKAVLADTVPQVAGKNITKGGYLLANEPHWFTATKEWDTGPVSKYTLDNFRLWLAGQHGDIAALNTLWKSTFASFDDVSITIPIDQQLRGQPIWYDWCRFNMHRVTGFFGFMKNEIRSHDPEAKVHIKILPDHLTNPSRSHGMDMEALVRLQDIIGCDVKIVNDTHPRFREPHMDHYSVNWREVAISYDFFKSMGPDKLIYDSEFHGLSTVHWRDPELSPEYVRCVYWLAHLHGMGMNTTWYWGREADGRPTPKDPKSFYASNLTQPRVMDAFGRVMNELNVFAPEVVAFARQPRHVRFFYSETEAINNPNYIYHISSHYEAVYRQGFPLGFATGQMLAELDDPEAIKNMIVVLSGASHVTDTEMQSLQDYLVRGGTVVVADKESLRFDAYGRPRSVKLKAGDHGRLISNPDVNAEVAAHRKARRLHQPIYLRETNELGSPGCVWRSIPYDHGYLLLVLNLGKSTAQIKLNTPGAGWQDYATGSAHDASFSLDSYGVKLLFADRAR